MGGFDINGVIVVYLDDDGREIFRETLVYEKAVASGLEPVIKFMRKQKARVVREGDKVFIAW